MSIAQANAAQAATQSSSSGYRLPRQQRLALATLLGGHPHAAIAIRLAEFLGRYHAVPQLLGRAFAIAKDSLGGCSGEKRQRDAHRHLGMTEWQVRKARDALVAVGFLEDATTDVPAPREGRDRRWKPVRWFRFGPRFFRIFAYAARRALAILRDRAVAAARAARNKLSDIDSRRGELHIGEAPRPKELSASDPKLEAALARLKEAAGIGGSGEGAGP